MIHFSRLRLSGFKSFVDPVEITIEDGMTGIVGPNGCGKSNLVEALRWVMGEISARQMRGSEMDDVIFSGSANRPPRDVAEVSLVLDNVSAELPPPFDKTPEIEIARRISRGDGSVYRVNGRETRARDVQTLFADLSSGARSTAIVGQGHIGAIISARPSDRRALLEEAAGIAGLHSRRAEAETRLRAADVNLERLVDILTTLEQQLQGLKKQARQAERYRALSQKIRDGERQLLNAQWWDAEKIYRDAKTAFSEFEGKVATLTGLAAQASTRQAEIYARLPLLRAAAAEASARLQRLRLAADQLGAEEARVLVQRTEAGRRVAEIAADLGGEAARLQDAKDALLALGEEKQRLEQADKGSKERFSCAEADVGVASADVGAIEAALAGMIEKLAAADAERGAALRQLSEMEDRVGRLTNRLAGADDDMRRIEMDKVDQAVLNSAEMDKEEAEEHLVHCRAMVEKAEQGRTVALAARDQARDRLQKANAALSTLDAEAKGLRAVLGGTKIGAWPPLIDQISTTEGYEAALGAALGEDLSAPLGAEGASRSWRNLDGVDPLADPVFPGHISVLAAFVTAPVALKRRLAQIGVVEDEKQAQQFQPLLKSGQRLVSLKGGLWRWDGYSEAPGAPSAAAVRLRQRARLRELEAMMEDARIGVASAQELAKTAEESQQKQGEAEKKARYSVRQAEIERQTRSEALFKLQRKAQHFEERMGSLKNQRALLAAEKEEAYRALKTMREAARNSPQGGEDREKLAMLRANVAQRRTRLVEVRAALDQMKSENADRARRLAAIEKEAVSWEKRIASSAAHRADLEQRRDAAEAEIAALDKEPALLGEKRALLYQDIARTEEERGRTSDALAIGERAGQETDRAAKEAETALASAREERARRETKNQQAEQVLMDLSIELEERLGVRREKFWAQGRPNDLEPSAEIAQALEKVLRDREAMGPVNLMAEKEAAETEEKIQALIAERDDLVQAIAKLRQAILEINREGRERLLSSFETVDQHFRTLFARLFGGGRAHLSLTESSDPLQAGLEIMASPPGKRLQVLSLLSGGEQALTALALLFAVFMSNPAPICVLDEVDAPLDDANVDRFCNLVAEIAATTKTRFLVITHHRMTMARMDRLFGVTMAERGVSSLVSVNLGRAEALALADERKATV